MVPFVFALEVEGLGSDYSVDAAYLVTYLPAYFKQIIRFDKFCFHFRNQNYLVSPARTWDSVRGY